MLNAFGTVCVPTLGSALGIKYLKNKQLFSHDGQPKESFLNYFGSVKVCDNWEHNMQ